MAEYYYALQRRHVSENTNLTKAVAGFFCRESATFNFLELRAREREPRTPVLDCRLTRALEPLPEKYPSAREFFNKYKRTIINWASYFRTPRQFVRNEKRPFTVGSIECSRLFAYVARLHVVALSRILDQRAFCTLGSRRGLLTQMCARNISCISFGDFLGSLYGR